MVAGGFDPYGSNRISSVVALFPGAKDWTPLASLPRTLMGAGALIVGDRIRVTGGSYKRDGSVSEEVMSFHSKLSKTCSYGSRNCDL